MMLLSATLTVFFTTAGLALSYGPNWPAGATIIVIAGAVYLVAVAGPRLFVPKR